MSKVKKSLFVITVLSLAACASNTPQKGQTVFKTRITDSGLKHFQLGFPQRRSADQDIESRKPSGRRERSNRRVDKNRYEKIQKQLLAFANAEVERSKYCRQGFWVLKNEADAVNPYLRGECNEQATPADRKRFPDTIKNW